MCRYCKKLKELNSLREKELQKCIQNWRRYAYKASAIMTRAIDAIDEACASDELTEEDICDLENCVSEMLSWKSIDFVGK